MKKLILASVTSVMAIPVFGCAKPQANEVKATSEVYQINNVNNQEDGVWEKDYINSSADYNIHGYLDMGQYLGKIIFGTAVKNPVAIVDGVHGILSTFTSAISSSEASVQDVFDKLVDLDEKLDQITELIERNQTEIINEQIYTEAQIDKALIEIYQHNYNEFVANYLNPLDSIQRDYTQFIAAELQNFVTLDNPYIELHYEVKDGTYKLLSRTEANYANPGIQIYKVNIPSFSNSKAFLKNHNDTVTTGFVDELKKDFANAVTQAIQNGTLKVDENITNEDYKIHMYKVILDDAEIKKHTGTYGSDAYKEAASILDNAINLCESVSGRKTGQSILESVIERIKCIYNFGKEAKPQIRHLIAHIKLLVDRYSALASEACLHAKIDQSELGEQYKKAVEKIQAYSKANEETGDFYSYIVKQEMRGTFVQTIYNVDYKNKGNDCQFKKEFEMYRITGYDSWAIRNQVHKEKMDLSKMSFVGSAAIEKIQKRQELMEGMGLIKNQTLIDYLGSVDIMESGARSFQDIMEYKKYIGHDSYRLLTEFTGERELKKSENIKVTCVKTGNDAGNHFRLKDTYTFKQWDDEEYWEGYMKTGNYLDPDTGTRLSIHDISGWAKYTERHCYWFNDEHWAFQTNPNGDYMFVIYAQI